MDSHLCSCCGGVDGDGMSSVLPVQIASKFGGEPDHRRSVPLCRRCKAAMPIDIGALVSLVDMQPNERAADDAILEGFLTTYIRDVWPQDVAPSYQQLCRVLNAIGVSATRGGRWEYHNLQQRMMRMDIDRDALVAERAKKTYGERVRDLVDRAAEYTATQIASGRVEETRQELDRDWAPPEAPELPADMPGQLETV